MAWKQRFRGGLLAAIGFMLSPLSWWNDLVINLPLAIAFAWVVSFFYRPAFDACVIIGYWLTNIIGLLLMHKGAVKIVSETDRKYSRKALLTDIGVSLAYTALIVALLKLGILKPIKTYFANHPP
jgi:hypothetical protein